MDARTEEIRAQVEKASAAKDRRDYKQAKPVHTDLLTELSALREEVERLRTLVTDKEPNGYPLWFNRAVHECSDCDSEDLCARHWKMADSDFANCESEVAAFLAALSPSPAQQAK